MANEQNLTHEPIRSSEEASRLGRLGGIASGKARRRKRDMAALAGVMLGQKLTGTAAENLKLVYPDLDEDATMSARVIAGQIRSAYQGSAKSAEFLFNLEERDKENAGVETPSYVISPLDMTTDCIEPYRTLHRFYDGEIELTDMVLKGGRGGVKSTFACRLAYETMKQDALANVVFGRRYNSDLRDSVFTQFMRLIVENKEQHLWKVTKSPFRCLYRPNGTSAYFYGFEDAEKLKSYMPETGYVKLLIFEEADELLGNEQMDNAADTFLRSNGYPNARQLRMKVYNPPASKNNFMNEWVAEHANDSDVAIFDFSYLNVPVEWLGEGFFQRAAKAKEERPEFYANNYLGEVTGEGGELFSNVEEKTLTDEEVKELEYGCYQGLDFGFEHPMAFIRVDYDYETDTVTPFFENVAQRSKLSDFLRPIDMYRTQETICDSAEPDRIQQMLDWDWDAVKAVKSWKGGGRAFSWEWLRTRTKIVIDPVRTPNLARELRTLEFEKVKGGYASRYPDLGEDCVMALIYALNRVIRRASTTERYYE